MFRPLIKISNKYLSTKTSFSPKICIVGAGPAGFYAAQHLSKKLHDSEIDIIEKLPVPFGLVRFGVAPDHPEVKNVIHTFSKTAATPNVNFFGNIEFGKDISLNELKQSYHIVLLAYGAEENRKLNIAGESLKNVIPARKIVGWYNGVPSDSLLKVDLTTESLAIIGQGNVAIDVARILLTPVDKLKTTDITQHSLEQLAQSKIKEVYLIGRRGPLQAAFTIKELREMLKLKNCQTAWRKKDFDHIRKDIVNKLARPRKRITELMLKSVEEQMIADINGKVFRPIFLRSPIEILGVGNVEKVLLGVNQLEGDDFNKQKACLTDIKEIIECGLLVTSIGYTSLQVDPGIPFDSNKGIAINTHGKIDAGLYTTGWLSTGPLGVILSTMSNAFGVADKIIEDVLKSDILSTTKPGFAQVQKVLKKKNVQIVDWKDWEKIDQYEVIEGMKVGKPREKIIDIGKMLQIAAS
ncbi:NADPH:adrenodoxin oxidoreductase, mitochondrial [Euwallacea fornicatus]|uniref:NADPH:adrenodoxin oxidoreductase, mitochondrial n=1 Tax=Euwallacea fornicatus TaxID=995702 RepID=UPI00338F9BF2